MRVFISCDLDLLTSQSMHADRLPQSIMCTKFAVDSSTVSQHGQTDRHTHTHTHPQTHSHRRHWSPYPTHRLCRRGIMSCLSTWRQGEACHMQLKGASHNQYAQTDKCVRQTTCETGKAWLLCKRPYHGPQQARPHACPSAYNQYASQTHKYYSTGRQLQHKDTGVVHVQQWQLNSPRGGND